MAGVRKWLMLQKIQRKDVIQSLTEFVYLADVTIGLLD